MAEKKAEKPKADYVGPKESIDSLFKERDEYVTNPKKLELPVQNSFTKLYDTSMNVLKRGGVDEDGGVKHATLKDAFGDDLSHAEDLLLQYAFKVGLPGTHSKENAKNLEAEYKKYQKTGKVTDEFRKAHEEIKRHIETYFGAGWNPQKPDERLSYEGIIRAIHNTNLLNVFNPNGDNAHPLHAILNAYALQTNPHFMRLNYRTEAIHRLGADKKSEHHKKARGLLQKVIPKQDGLVVKEDADIKDMLGEYDKIRTKKDYRPLPGKVFVSLADLEKAKK